MPHQSNSALEPGASLDPATPDNPSNPSSARPDWRERAKQCRQQEWDLAQELLQTSRRLLLSHFARMRETASLAQVEWILKLATKLARVSTDLTHNPGDAESECPACCAAREEWESALKRIYGRKKKDQVPSGADAATGAPASAPASTPTQR